MQALQALISERIQREGAITFADYMQMALYQPELGYYVSGPAKMGWHGDYFTSSDLSDIFTRCLGRQLLHLWQQLGEPNPFCVLEQGAGRGQLADSVRNWAKQTPLAATLHYQSTDIRMGEDARTTTSQVSASHVVLSNELIDAFPVHIVEKQNHRLYEVYVALQGNRLYEVLSEPDSEQVATYLDSYKIPWQSYSDGWRAEVNLAALDWMQQTTSLLTQSAQTKQAGGFLLVIDYGEKARQLYTHNRHQGTLACYYQHQLSERPLLRPGAQDITAHVNFSALLAEGRRQGLHLHTYSTQRQWLKKLGIEQELEELRQRDFAIIDSDRASDKGQTALFQWYNLRQRVQTLTDPNGMGNFKVLILQH